MDEPAEEEDPHHAREDEVDQGHQDAALDQLAEAGNEEAAERCDNVAGGALSCHTRDVRRAADGDKRFFPIGEIARRRAPAYCLRHEAAVFAGVCVRAFGGLGRRVGISIL